MTELSSDELKKKLKDLEEKYHMSEGKLKAWALLTNGIVHNLNNILMGIQGYATILEMNTLNDENQKEYTLEIHQLIKKATTMVEELSVFSKSGRTEIKALNLNKVISRALEIMEMPGRNIRLNKIFFNDLWEIDADHHQIQHIVLNFLFLAWSQFFLCPFVFFQ